jgi:CheY-like chemotaxis protein
MPARTLQMRAVPAVAVKLQAMVRILVINDDDDLLDLYADILRGMGHEPVVKKIAASGPGMVRDVAAEALIVDLQLPDEDEYGLRIIEELRKDPEMASFPIVLATAAGAELEPAMPRLQALEVQVLHKPFDVAELESALDYSFSAQEE